ncbi:tRNA 4-thiouridine(8) synthase ThiI [Archaeoglobales archaeon ex4484_92]|nr:MAG: tRNA 4-thiouridine(8) synthase ThiI [Archaeoglobales archaeon ex4484_92]
MIYLIRYSEIFLKSEYVRREWEKQLIRNIKKLTKKKFKTKRERGRIFLTTDANIENELSRVFGISSFSKVDHCKLHELEKYVVEFCRREIKDSRTFAVRIKRVGEHNFTSLEKASEIGRLIKEKYPALKVDLKNPDFTLYVEIRNDDCYIFSKIYKGPGGIPVGVSGSLVSLFSGGLDSTVATLLMMKRGCKVFPIHFDLGRFGNTLVQANKVMEKLKLYDPEIELRIVDHEDFLSKALDFLKKKGKLSYICILCKRRMLKISEEYAKDLKALGIVTGDSIGQVASQTLENLFAISEACNLPIYRPLSGMDKIEIERIGSYFDLQPIQTKCLAAPKRPKTKCNLDTVKSLEEKLNR